MLAENATVMTTRFFKKCPDIFGTTSMFWRSCMLPAMWPSTRWLGWARACHCCQVQFFKTSIQLILCGIRIRTTRSKGWCQRIRWAWRRRYWSEARRDMRRTWNSMWCEQKSSSLSVLSTLNLMSSKWCDRNYRCLGFSRRLCRSSKSEKWIDLLSTFWGVSNTRSIKFYNSVKILKN